MVNGGDAVVGDKENWAERETQYRESRRNKEKNRQAKQSGRATGRHVKVLAVTLAPSVSASRAHAAGRLFPLPLPFLEDVGSGAAVLGPCVALLPPCDAHVVLGRPCAYTWLVHISRPLAVCAHRHRTPKTVRP